MPESNKCFEDDLPIVFEPVERHDCGWPQQYCPICEAEQEREWQAYNAMIDSLRAELHP